MFKNFTWRTSRLLPCPGYYKQCCDEHWGTRVSFPSGFLSVTMILFPALWVQTIISNREHLLSSFTEWSQFRNNGFYHYILIHVKAALREKQLLCVFVCVHFQRNFHTSFWREMAEVLLPNNKAESLVMYRDESRTLKCPPVKVIVPLSTQSSWGSWSIETWKNLKDMIGKEQ